jgi:ABC-type transporter Mla MlaB component
MAFHRTAVVAVPVRAGEHACCHFAQADDRERMAVAFVHDRLRRGDKVVYFFDGDDAAALVSRLERLDPGFEPAMARGQFEVRRARDVYIPDGRFEADRMLAMLREEHDRARAEGYSGLSVTGEMPDAICELPGGEQLGAYEARIASDVGAPSYSVLCQYDHGRFGPGLLSDVIKAHGIYASPELAAIGRDGELAAARDRDRDALRLAGELDFGCAQTVSEVLDEHFHGPLRLDLADLSYVDVAGMRALRGHKGQRLTIGPASDAVRRLLALLAWDTDPEIELRETG